MEPNRHSVEEVLIDFALCQIFSLNYLINKNNDRLEIVKP